jgi:hypothetical protein
MKAAGREVLRHLIDYAGLFPPAALPMAEAVAAFAAYQRRDDGWALGRFVVPAARLEEFERAVEELPEQEGIGARWPLSVLLGAEPLPEVERLRIFRERHHQAGPVAQAVEARAGDVAAIESLRGAVPAALELYIELAPGPALPGLLAAVERAGARAKIRAGGVRPEEIPAPETVFAVLRAVAEARVPFKATAGLHHPVRGVAPLTYEPGSLRATMFGYLNLILAAALLWEGRAAEAERVIRLEDRSVLCLGDDGIRWDGITVKLGAIARARREFVLAIGSCSFTEPVEEIEGL